MQHKHIGIIGALTDETEALISKIDNVKKIEMIGTTYYYGEIYKKPVVIVTCGIGKVNAACITQAMIQEFDVGYVINTGIAGGIGNQIKPCDIVISDNVVYHDFITDEPYFKPFTASEHLIKLAKDACTESEHDHKFNHYTGRIATGDQFITDTESKNKIVSLCDPLCVEMEGGAIAHCCTLNSVPFVVIRAISDCADDDAKISFYEFKEIAANISASIVLSMLKNI